MNARQREGLRRLGVIPKKYFLEVDEDKPIVPGNLPVWGLALIRDGETIAVIEYEEDIAGSHGIYHLRHSRRGEPFHPRSQFRLQRLAVAEWARTLL